MIRLCRVSCELSWEREAEKMKTFSFSFSFPPPHTFSLWTFWTVVEQSTEPSKEEKPKQNIQHVQAQCNEGKFTFPTTCFSRHFPLLASHRLQFSLRIFHDSPLPSSHEWNRSSSVISLDFSNSLVTYWIRFYVTKSFEFKRILIFQEKTLISRKLKKNINLNRMKTRFLQFNLRWKLDIQWQDLWSLSMWTELNVRFMLSLWQLVDVDDLKTQISTAFLLLQHFES